MTKITWKDRIKLFIFVEVLGLSVVGLTHIVCLIASYEMDLNAYWIIALVIAGASVIADIATPIFMWFMDL